MRFHLYWAGSDRDGAVTGYYWAVVETLATPPGDGLPIPNLPGPKASDYHFTTRSDSTFIFRASEDVSEREHAFFVYSVDNKGKPDPTPARFIFRAYDRFPPTPVIDVARATGTVYTVTGGGVVPSVQTYDITDTYAIEKQFPRDTVPTGSKLYFQWHGEPAVPNGHVLGYRYKLDESSFNVVDSSVHSVTYNDGPGTTPVAPGLKVFTLRAVGESGWRGQTTRYFQVNFAPDSWFSGPNVNNPAEGWSTFSDRNGKQYWYKDVANWTSFAGVPGTLLSPDSALVLPANRVERRTFFEIYKDKIWAHQEGDTVHLNSWVVFPAGGSDKDSPYRVKADPITPGMPVGDVTTPGPANGSPVALRSHVLTVQLDGNLTNPSETPAFPVFDIASVYHSPHILPYASMSSTGIAYAYAVSEDGDGTVDRRLRRVALRQDSVAYYADVLHRPDAEAVRSKILKFYVNHAPFLKTSDGSFRPAVPSGTGVPASISRTSAFNILADDLDPIDFTKPIVRVGGPQSGVQPVLIRTIDIVQFGSTPDSANIVRASYNVATNLDVASIPTVTIPSTILPGRIYVRIKLADNRPDDQAHGARLLRAPDRNGVMQDYFEYPVTLNAPGPEDAAIESVPSTQRPGSPPTSGRRQ
ncbi:MAG: hypothetical protein U0704_04005 [Candidatus Eisenbacteria bacterium]